MTNHDQAPRRCRLAAGRARSGNRIGVRHRVGSRNRGEALSQDGGGD
ncbi:MAG: hypothetical protein M0013_02270 [Actinomycetota bacterium]|nr:hypothetical protein [Actinomycetota bacterium]